MLRGGQGIRRRNDFYSFTKETIKQKVGEFINSRPTVKEILKLFFKQRENDRNSPPPQNIRNQSCFHTLLGPVSFNPSYTSE